jgi:hypothetical protein
MRNKGKLKYALCGKKVISKEQDALMEMIDGTSHTSDSNDCVLMLTY